MKVQEIILSTNKDRYISTRLLYHIAYEGESKAWFEEDYDSNNEHAFAHP